MDDEEFENAALMEDFMDTGRGAGLIGGIFWMFLGILEGLAAGYFLCTEEFSPAY